VAIRSAASSRTRESPPRSRVPGPPASEGELRRHSSPCFDLHVFENTERAIDDYRPRPPSIASPVPPLRGGYGGLRALPYAVLGADGRRFDPGRPDQYFEGFTQPRPSAEPERVRGGVRKKPGSAGSPPPRPDILVSYFEGVFAEKFRRRAALGVAALRDRFCAESSASVTLRRDSSLGLA
jgi:hypothetical protein